jgi:hypothetical protein
VVNIFPEEHSLASILYPQYEETRRTCIVEDAGFEKWRNGEGITGETEDGKPMKGYGEDQEGLT